MIRLAIVAAAATLIATLGVLVANTGSENEVRITARCLDDGRTESALQQRTDGEWGERVLPNARIFPADPGTDGWFSSSPVSMGSADRPSCDCQRTLILVSEWLDQRADLQTQWASS